jgi:hypothetical protein
LKPKPFILLVILVFFEVFEAQTLYFTCHSCLLLDFWRILRIITKGY